MSRRGRCMKQLHTDATPAKPRGNKQPADSGEVVGPEIRCGLGALACRVLTSIVERHVATHLTARFFCDPRLELVRRCNKANRVLRPVRRVTIDLVNPPEYLNAGRYVAVPPGTNLHVRHRSRLPVEPHVRQPLSV